MSLFAKLKSSQTSNFLHSLLCAQSHYHKSHHRLPRQLRNRGTPGSPLKRGQIPQDNTPSQFQWTGQRLYKTQSFCLQTRGHAAQRTAIRGQHLSKQQENDSLQFTAPLQSCRWPSQGSPSYLIKLILSAKISVSSLVGVTFSTKAIPYNKKFRRNSFSPSSVSRKLRQSTDGTWAWR